MLLTLLYDRSGLSSFPNLFLPPDLNIDAIPSNHTPFNSPRWADSNELCADLIRPLGQKLPTLLYICSPGRYLQIVGCGLLQACKDFEPYTIRFLSTSRFQRCPSRAWQLPGCWASIHLFLPLDLSSGPLPISWAWYLLCPTCIPIFFLFTFNK